MKQAGTRWFGSRRPVVWMALAALFGTSEIRADTNDWTGAVSGRWDDPTWSLGVLPDSTQSVQITNGGWKAVSIDALTVANEPGSLTVHDLAVRNLLGGENTLLLNFAGTATPLRVLNGLDLNAGGRIVNFNSGLSVEGGSVTVQFAEIVQDGGFIRMTNGPVYFHDANCYVTNGLFEAGNVDFGAGESATFNQYGGIVNIASLQFDSRSGASVYTLYGGLLNIGQVWLGVSFGSSDFSQLGGTNCVSSLNVGPALYGTGGNYHLHGGRLSEGNLFVAAAPTSGGVFEQSGGINAVSNNVIVQGAQNSPSSASGGWYVLSNGVFSATSLTIGAYASYVQYGGSGSIAGTISLSEGTPFFRSSSSLYGGMLACANFESGRTNEVGGDWLQSGGTLIVSNTLSFGGRSPWSFGGGGFATFILNGGLLVASNIDVVTAFLVGSGTPGRITNPGSFKLAGELSVADVDEQLGRFILASNAVIDLKGAASKLAFSASAAESWVSPAVLLVSNWNGSAGGGGSEQLKMGADTSGLTAGQLAQVRFINPAGFAAGVYGATNLNSGELVPTMFAPAAFTNDWTGTNGNWQDNTWSLGVLPNMWQSVRIPGGARTVTIGAGTSSSDPGSLTVDDLNVNGASAATTLFLNNAGTFYPLRSLNGVSVQDSGRIIVLNSALVVDGGKFALSGGEVFQDGGFVRTTNAPLSIDNAAYYLTNGVFEAGTLLIGSGEYGRFNQYGGTASVRSLAFGAGAPVGAVGGTYALAGGYLNASNLQIVADYNGAAEFLQSGGTNRATQVTVASGLFGSYVSYSLTGGALCASNLSVLAGGASASFVQNGSINTISNTLHLEGASRHGSFRFATYTLASGALSARDLNVYSYAALVQSNGTISVSDTLNLAGADFFGRSTSCLYGGTLACGNMLSSIIGNDFVQSGGTLIVSNLFSFGGMKLQSGAVPTYMFTGGTLVASNIELWAEFVIGSSPTAHRITNGGYFKLSGILRSGDASEQLGGFILSSNALIDLGLGNARISFTDSSGQSWNSSAMLLISNWSGSITGGGNDRLKFGGNASGLTAAQLNQVRFLNPAGFPAATYPAQILTTGEIVPGPRPAVTTVRNGSKLVLTWPANCILQSSTNVVGPYLDVPGATSPYTNDVTTDPQRFFRLRE
jgi:hypothetical protein